MNISKFCEKLKYKYIERRFGTGYHQLHSKTRVLITFLQS